MSENLTDRIAMVTGGAGGIGRAVSLKLATEGARVIILGRNREKGQETLNLIRSKGGSAAFYRLDLSDPESLDEQLRALPAADRNVDILVNNAGISGFTGPVADTPIAEAEEVLKVNALAPYRLSGLVVKTMLEKGFGRIINISSVAPRVNPPNSSSYNMSKAALNSFTVSLSREVAAGGVTVNALAPGLVLTDRIRTSRIPALAEASGSAPEDILAKMTEQADSRRLTTESQLAETVLFLCSDSAGNITGEIIEMSGGY